MKGPEDPWVQLQKALAECSLLREENAHLKRLIAGPGIQSDESSESTPVAQVDRSTTLTSDLLNNSSPPEVKIALFRSLFRGREDVYAVRWDGKSGRSGYSPAGIREWEPTLTSNTKRKAINFKIRAFFPLTDDVIRDHLTGGHTVGIYPLLLDETCYFLAACKEYLTCILSRRCRELVANYPACRLTSRSSRRAATRSMFRCLNGSYLPQPAAERGR